MRALDIAATGMQAQQLNVEVISNNIANLNTTGFKRQRAEFQDLLYQDIRRPGDNSSDQNTIVPVGVQIGIGVKTAAVYRINQQGNLSQTQNPLDLAIQGQGYFQVQLPSGQTAYTRAGSLQLNASRQIVTADGYLLLPNITIPQGTTSVTVPSVMPARPCSTSVPGMTSRCWSGSAASAPALSPSCPKVRTCCSRRRLREPRRCRIPA